MTCTSILISGVLEKVTECSIVCWKGMDKADSPHKSKIRKIIFYFKNYEYILKTSILISDEEMIFFLKKYHKKIFRRVFDCIKLIGIMSTQTHREISFLTLMMSTKLHIWKFLILGSFLKNHFSHYVWLYFVRK